MLKRKHQPHATPSPGEPIVAEVNYLDLALAKVPIFSACTPDELLHVAGLTMVRDAAAGQAMVNEGDKGDEFFVILRGEATVTRGGQAVAHLGPGDFFGELALFDPAPRNATVTADGDVQVAVLTELAFRDALRETPIRDNVFLGMARRLHQLDGSV